MAPPPPPGARIIKFHMVGFQFKPECLAKFFDQNPRLPMIFKYDFFDIFNPLTSRNCLAKTLKNSFWIKIVSTNFEQSKSEKKTNIIFEKIVY